MNIGVLWRLRRFCVEIGFDRVSVPLLAKRTRKNISSRSIFYDRYVQYSV
jgi:hypothetical protein